MTDTGTDTPGVERSVSMGSVNRTGASVHASRTKAEREAQLVRLAELYRKGATQQAMARELGLARSTVQLDLKKLHAEWRKRRFDDMDDAKVRELEKVDLIERTAWDEWERSREPAERSVTERQTVELPDGAGGKTPAERVKAQLTQEGRLGDPRYLERIAWCIDKRCKVLGLDAPEKINVEGETWVQIARRERAREARDR